MLALTTYHVQIITRISSCLPGICWWVAELLVREARVDSSPRPESNGGGSLERPTVVDDCRKSSGKLVVRMCVTWILFQTVLFAAFLPPA